ncbi:mitochondrial ribosome and complex I assembly factor AltMIEF1 [Drosophila sulfurigaster albostrigata]|uniref:MIEF1 upstream open reading frame protein n=1 Tax=Drosophila albomicans TaxID=7291 RepID=A0A6P8X331_DROAB|nr:MIEF1 upstream open reading frame protein [Drosophila albomicans]XP_060654847.1 mitochondrial ribosome and complex I assembly factor AltMIEF1 [Drosophila nasuta]XP_062130409.1 mitochondrial ribosome and complex I assembly factor AltMIEF1 [Drosophila sulfurigaster albostrigata]
MLPPSRQQVLRLYKHLIKYGNHLTLTDKNYFLGRVRHEFRENRELTNPLQIEFNFKRGETLLKKGRIL